MLDRITKQQPSSFETHQVMLTNAINERVATIYNLLLDGRNRNTYQERSLQSFAVELYLNSSYQVRAGVFRAVATDTVIFQGFAVAFYNHFYCLHGSKTELTDEEEKLKQQAVNFVKLCQEPQRLSIAGKSSQ